MSVLVFALEQQFRRTDVQAGFFPAFTLRTPGLRLTVTAFAAGELVISGQRAVVTARANEEPTATFDNRDSNSS